MKKGELILVGAGPGDPELITIKGMKAIAAGDVILYDALVNPELLEYAPHAIKVFVGKRKGYCKYSQEQINKTIVAYAAKGMKVVRLKGGDPFVFGRGFEELAFAAEFGFSTQVIPGLSSSISVPAINQIPVTSRGVTESFWVITGTTKKHKLSKDIALASRVDTTVVILMGVSKIEEIMNVFQASNKSEIPVAVIQEGSRDTSKVVKGTVQNIAEKVRDEDIQNPAIIIVGKTVNLIDQLQNQTVLQNFA